LTARKKLGHQGHTEAVRRIAAALDIDLDQAASVLGQRGHAEAVRRISVALGIDLDQAASELSQRGGNGRVAGAGKYSKHLGRVAKTMSEAGVEGTRADERGMAGLFFSERKTRFRAM